MMNAYDYLDDYMNGLLHGEERAAFERLISEDAELNSIIENYDEIKSASKGILELDLLAEVEGVAHSVVDEITSNVKVELNPKSNDSGTHFLRYVAIIAMLAGAYFAYKYFNNVGQDQEQEKVIFADLYKEPIWPIERRVDVDRIGVGVNYYLVDKDLELAKIILLDSVIDTRAGRYWLAEMYADRQMWDSVDVYLPLEESGWIKNDRVKYLRILSLIDEGKLEEARSMVKELPEQYKIMITSFLDQ